jgi:hypothetical protein
MLIEGRDMKRSSVVVAASFFATLFAAGTVAANPIIMCGTNACQVTGTLHAQVSYFCDGGPDCKAPSSSVKRNGEMITVAWQGPTGIDVNGGSGVTTFQAHQFCDCEVGTGSLEYVLDLGVIEYCAGETSTTIYPVVTAQDVGVSVAEVAQDVPAQGDVAAVSDVVMPQDIGTGEIAPWDEPAPPWPKGLDCVQWCKDNPKNPDVTPEGTAVPSDVAMIDTATTAGEMPASIDTAVASTDGTTASADNANQEKPADSSSACSASTTTIAVAALPALLLLVLPWIALVPARRRRD